MRKSSADRLVDKFLEQSDEEVLGYDGLDDDEDDDEEAGDAAESSDDDADKRKRAADEDEDMEGWGPSKKDYYNADAIETEQDALDEEEEARRLQKKQLQAMTEADFGFDEDEWLGQDDDKGADAGVVTEVLPQLQITDDMGEAEKLKILRTRYPEFEHISNEFLRLQPLHDELAAAANAAERLVKSRAAKSDKSNSELLRTPKAVTKYRACAAYLAAMSMYFAILGSTANDDGSPVIALDPAELHDHPVMETLLKCQQLWKRVESLPVADPMVEATQGDELSAIEEDSLVSESEEDTKVKTPHPKKTKSQRAAELAQAKSAARRAEKLRQAEQDLTSLAPLTDKKALQKAARQKKKVEKQPKPKTNLLNADDSDFGEETELTAHELAEKARKKKSLRFYTSQITQKANKRDAAGKDYGGDADIPHRERLKDRQSRLQAEAEKKGQNADSGPGVPLGEGGDDSSGEEDNTQRNNDAEFEDADGYYDMVAARSTAKKQDKLDRATAYALAAKEGGVVVPEEIIGEDGRRQISYAIEKNKGLTPHRKKSVRNPRVKKKLAYESKKKKMRSMKPVFDAGKKASGQAAYGGELTGIKKGLVRARKL
jgi:U3 small nucleolar RNA-associated protein 3